MEGRGLQIRRSTTRSGITVGDSPIASTPTCGELSTLFREVYEKLVSIANHAADRNGKDTTIGGNDDGSALHAWILDIFHGDVERKRNITCYYTHPILVGIYSESIRCGNIGNGQCARTNVLNKVFNHGISYHPTEILGRARCHSLCCLSVAVDSHLRVIGVQLEAFKIIKIIIIRLKTELVVACFKACYCCSTRIT